MAIQMRRGNEADLDISQLEAGEIAVCVDTGKTVIKLAGENYIVLADSKSVEELNTVLELKAPLEHRHSIADIDGVDVGSTVLYDNPDGDNTSETIALSDNAENYSMLEVVYGTAATRQTVRCAAGDTDPTIMSLVGGNDASMSFFSGAFLPQGDTLLRGTALSTALGQTTLSERSFSIVHDTDGELAFLGSSKTSAEGYYIKMVSCQGKRNTFKLNATM